MEHHVNCGVGETDPLKCTCGLDAHDRAIRRAALEEAAQACWSIEIDHVDVGFRMGAFRCNSAIRALIDKLDKGPKP